MKKFFNILSSLIISFLLLVILFNLPYGEIKVFFQDTFESIKNIFTDIGDNIIFQHTYESTNAYIKDVDYAVKQDKYELIIEFKQIDPNKLISIEINDATYDEFEVLTDQNENGIKITVDNLFNGNSFVKIIITSITTTEEVYQTAYETTLFSSVDYQLIELRKKSAVGITVRQRTFYGWNNIKWGSGVILSKEEIIKKDRFGNDTTYYEYIIITNSHVVEEGPNYRLRIHYDDYHNIYPKTYESIELLGIYTNKTDLAFIKLTSLDDSLVPLNDEQLLTKTPIQREVGEFVFLIGSPSDNSMPYGINFNTCRIGSIKKINIPVKLSNSDTLCKNGCNSIQTNAYLGPGSSGGGVYDANGKLVGIHFAGFEDYNYAFLIPIPQIIEAMEAILEPEPALYYETRSQPTSFFFLKMKIY